jgi:hypothetical protein
MGTGEGVKRSVARRLHPRRGVALRMAALAVVLLGPCAWPAAARATTALLVVGDATVLSPSDLALKQRLERYYATTVRDDGLAADTTKDAVVISGSVVASTLGTKYRSITRGVVVLAPAVLPAMAMTATGAVGTLEGSHVKIAYGRTMLAAGFATGAAVPVYGSTRSLGWGTPASTALKVAVTADGDTSRATIFRYATSSLMVGNVAARGRRIFVGLGAAEALTDGGLALFDNAVAVAAMLTAVPPLLSPPPPPPPPPTTRSGPLPAAGRTRNPLRSAWTRRVPPTP